MAIEVYINTDLDQFQAISRRSKSLRPALSRIANMVKEDARLSFVEQKSPYGRGWKPLKVSTYMRKGRGGPSAKPLRHTGRLVNSITVGRVTNQEASVGTNVIYAAVHNFGSRDRVIPQRQYLPTNGLTRAQQKEAQDIIREYLING